MPPSRQVLHGDAIEWLRDHPDTPGASLLTSLPDVSELGVTPKAWEAFFSQAARLCLQAVPAQGVCAFYQTDVKDDGRWISKPALIFAEAQALQIPLLWHKIVCRYPPGQRAHGRPGFAHLLAFSREVRDDPARPTGDVLPDRGEVPWSHGMGFAPARLVVDFIRARSPATTVLLAPFCGSGTALAAAEERGLDSLGIERNKKRAEGARRLR